MVLAATPPVLLFFSFEALMHSVQADMERVIKDQKKASPQRKEETVVPQKQVQKTTSIKKSDRLAKVKALKDQGMTPSQIVRQLENVSLRTVQRDIATLEKNEKRADE